MTESEGRGRKRPSLIDVYPSPARPAAENMPSGTTGIEPQAAERAPSGDRTSIYLPPGALRALKEIALDRDCKVNDLLIEGVEAVLRKHGRLLTPGFKDSS
jgi:hypothetical protein